MVGCEFKRFVRGSSDTPGYRQGGEGGPYLEGRFRQGTRLLRAMQKPRLGGIKTTKVR